MEEAGPPYLVPLSFLWDGITLLVATPSSSPTSRNLQARLAIDPSCDLVLVEGTAHALTATEISDEAGDAFAAKNRLRPRAGSVAPTSTSAFTRGGSRPGAKPTNSRAASS